MTWLNATCAHLSDILPQEHLPHDPHNNYWLYASRIKNEQRKMKNKKWKIIMLEIEMKNKKGW